MKINPIVVILLLFLIRSVSVNAACSSKPLSFYPKSVMIDSVAENSFYPGKPLTYNGQVLELNIEEESVFDMNFPGCLGNLIGAKEAHATPLDPVIPGIYYINNGKQYSIFKTSVPGIGYAVGIRDFKADLSQEIPIGSGKTQTYPFPGSSNTTPKIGYKARLIFVATQNSLKSGNYTIQAQNILSLTVDPVIGYGPEATVLGLSPATFTIEVSGCDVTSPARQIVNMPPISLSLDDLSTDEKKGRFNISLKCDANVAVYATVTDVNNPTYLGDILRPSSDSTAKGIGLKLFKYNENDPIKFGPDSPEKGNINQWYVGGSNNTSSTYYVIPFQAQYTILPEYNNTKKIIAGEFHAEASITFSYQ